VRGVVILTLNLRNFNTFTPPVKDPLVYNQS